MTTTDHAPHVDTGESWIKQDWIYIKTAIILAIFTGIEVFTYFESVHNMPDWLLILTLSFLMAVKFALVCAIFMHLKDDNAIFTKMIVMGLCVAWPVYFVMAYAFGFLPDWHWTIKVAFLSVPPIIVGSWLGFSFKGGDGGH